MDAADKIAVEHFRRVYFSMCVEADKLIGRILDALKAGGSRGQPYIVFLSDHGEHALEHRQNGKNSMLEASSRVPLVIAGPGVPKGSSSSALASLHDVYPTVLAMAGAKPRAGPLAGENLLPVTAGAPRRRDFVVSEYHSVYSGTGIFMVRHNDGNHNWKLVLYAAQQPGMQAWPAQLFDLSTDPWERNNLADNHGERVDSLRSMLAKEVDMAEADEAKKTFDKYMFYTYWYKKKGGADGCASAMKHVYNGFDPDQDAGLIERWLGKPCPTGKVPVLFA